VQFSKTKTKQKLDPKNPKPTKRKAVRVTAGDLL
jgi:hypothetical protein